MSKSNIYLQVIYSIIFIVLINSIGSFVYFRLDLTAEKRHTLSIATEKILTDLDDIIYIKVYLDGDFPAGFKRLQNQSRETLENFKNIAGKRLDFEFINPSASSSEEERKAVYTQLLEQGLQPTDLQVKEQAGMSSSIIFPGAIIYYKQQHTAVQLLKNEIGVLPEVALNNSIETLEYELITAISKLTRDKKQKIAFLKGHGELNEDEVADISYSVLSDSYSLSEYYEVEHFDISEFEIDSVNNKPDLVRQLQRLNTYKTIIIAKPQSAFNNIDKLLLDQYLMSGGNLFFLIDGISANMDSLNRSDGYFMAKKKQLNLDDFLFKYGARVNADLVQDKRAAQIPIITGYSANMPQQSFFAWPYYPLLFSDKKKHAISNSLDAIKCEFVSSIDTIKNHIKKTILLHSSANSRIVPSPHRVSLGILQNPPDATSFNNPNRAVAVLLEGEFESIFKNRIIPKNSGFDFKESGEEAKIILVGDGDIIQNDVSNKTGNIYPLGYDRFAEFIYPGNKTFIMNAVHYLCGNNQELLLSPLKTKQLKLRLLDKQKINNYKIYIQLLNVILPILLIIFFGIIYGFSRKRKYA
ncbi:MAG: gliding motility-associated ABC transporter substrate-binding protein GldG [Flavobacteriales bacterium TMED123]|nr:MAG: gliding motility-associated ABC transporter substrate-binding protein GldG [Flavobacteriales bacterium TMED123]